MSKKKRHDPNKFKVKEKLLNEHGYRCWLCGKEFKKDELTLHHIIEWQFTHHTVEEESCILCKHCHFDIVNKATYQSIYYNLLMELVEYYRIFNYR